MTAGRFLRVAAAACLLCAGVAAPGCRDAGGGRADFYVSPSGDDNADGTSPSRAFRTLVRARDAARMRGGTTRVELAGGMYELDAPVAFSAADRDLVFSAAPGARPVISAGRRVSAWRVGSDGWWRAEVDKGEDFAQLYVNGQRRLRPFLPRKGYFFAKDGAPRDPATGQARFVVRNGDFPEGDNPDMEVCMFNVWTMSRSHVRAYAPENRVVTLGIADFKNSFDKVNSGRWYRYDNVKTALGEPGDWFLDRRKGELTYVPQPGETPRGCEVVAARHEHAVTFDCATNIVWRGVVFAYAGYVVQTNGNYTGQAASGNPAAVLAEQSSGIRLERCAVVHTGAYAVEFARGCEGCAVVGCELRDLGAGGVKIGAAKRDFPGRASGKKMEFSRRCEVRDCLISEGGRVDPAGVGVWIGHATDNVVAHNTIRDMYYTGVSAGWNWSFAQTARDNLIEWNHIHDIGRGVLSDMGGIYLLGRQPGTLERYNHIHDITRARNCAFGIYFDSGTSLVTVSNNVVHDCQDSNFFLAAISASNRVDNNVFAFANGRQLHAAPRNQNSSPSYFTHNLVVYDKGMFERSMPNTNALACADNLYWCPAELRPKSSPPGFDFAELRFADAAARDLRIADESVACRAGFKPFSLAGCGRAAPAELTAGMPAVPDVFFPAPDPLPELVDEGFELAAVGTGFPKWNVLEPDGTGTVHVTESTAATGKRCLEIVDDKKDWRPHVYKSVSRTKGVVRLSFALRVEKGGEPRICLRGDQEGPVLQVKRDGTFAASGKPLMRLEYGRWYRIEACFALGPGRKRHSYSVSVSALDGESSRFDGIPLPADWRSFHWIGIHSCGSGGRYYLDDFKIIDG